MKQYPNIIKLYNRYRENYYLEQIKDNKYKIICDEYVRIGYPEGTSVEEMKTCKEYIFVDPSGGPFMQVNCEIDTYNEKERYKIIKLYSEQIAEKQWQLIAEIEHI